MGGYGQLGDLGWLLNEWCEGWQGGEDLAGPQSQSFIPLAPRSQGRLEQRDVEAGCFSGWGSGGGGRAGVGTPGGDAELSLLGAPFSQDSHLLGDAHSIPAPTPMSKLLGHPRSQAPEAETPAGSGVDSEGLGRERPPRGAFQKGMEGKAIRAEKTSKNQALPGDAGYRQMDI